MNLNKTSDIIKRLNIIALPLIIQSIFNIFIGLSDQTIIGRLSSEAYSGVSVAYQFYNTVIGVLGCTAIVFNIRGSEAKGEMNEQSLYTEFHASLWIEFIIGLLITICFLLFSPFILKTILGLNEATYSIIKGYYIFIAISAIFQMLIFSFNTYFKIIENTKYILYCGMITSLINLFLDYVLVLGKFGFPALQTTGAGIATCISLAINLILYIVITSSKLKEIKQYKLSFTHTKDRIMESLPLVGHELLEGSVFSVIILSIISHKSDALLGGYVLLVNVFNFILVPLFMYAQATLTLIGENNNKNKISYCLPIIKTAIILTFLCIGTLILLFILLNPVILPILNTNTSIIEMAQSFLILYSIFTLSKIPCVICTHSLQALNKSVFVLVLNTGIHIILLSSLFMFMYLCHDDLIFMRIFLIVLTLGHIALFTVEYHKIKTIVCNN